ncbi:MAG: hypothetical protein R6U70_00280 [Bacillota bacterium]
MGDNGRDAVIECSLKYSLCGVDGGGAEEGEATARVTEETLDLLPSSGEALLFTLREITDITASDYRLALDLSSGERLILYHLGYQYEDFCRVLSRMRNEMIIGDLLMKESLLTPGMKARYVHEDDEGGQEAGDCEVRLYETALVVIPEAADIVRLPYSYISSVREEDYTLEVQVEEAGSFVLSHLGRRLDHLRRSLADVMSELALATQRQLGELVPTVSPSVIRRAARLLRDGRAARRTDLEAISLELWSGLEDNLVDAGASGEYAFLKTLAQRDRMCIGFKRGLMGDLTGEYIWFLVPIYDTDPDRPGNAVAMEALSEGGGRATYFFRITGRGEYRRAPGLDFLHRETDAFIRDMNRCMLAINFRREPIYFPEERLMDPRYVHYRVAVERIPELKTLREHFIGRVIHHSPAQWERDVTDLLRFNVSVEEDGRRWQRTEGDAEPEKSQ